MSSTFATTRSPAPIVNRISVVAGVSETIFWGSAAMVTSVPSSSVRVTGKAAPDVGDGAALTGGAVGTAGRGGTRRRLGRGRAGGGEQDQRRIRTAGIGKRRAAMEVSGVGSGVGRTEARHGTSGRGCLSRSIASECLPFLSKVEQTLRVGDRTSIGPGEGQIDGHRSGTVPDFHRLRGPAACRLTTTREA